MKKTKWLSEEELGLINFNKYLLLQFYEKEETGGINPKKTTELSIIALSEKIELSYRATYRRVESLIEKKILLPKQEDKKRGKPVVLQINPEYKFKVGLYLSYAKTPEEQRSEKKDFLNNPITLKILKAIKEAGRPLNYGEISEKVEENDENYLENLDHYELIDTRYHITRKGSAFVQKNKSEKKKEDGK